METSQIALWVSLISAGFTGLSVVVAILAKMETRKLSEENQRLTEQSNAIQNRLVNIEEGRDRRSELAAQQAVFYVEAQMLPIPVQEFRLVIKNVGNGVARNVRFYVDRTEIMRWPSFKGADFGYFATFEVGKVATFTFSTQHFPQLRPNTMFLHWVDEAGMNQTQLIEQL